MYVNMQNSNGLEVITLRKSKRFLSILLAGVLVLSAVSLELATVVASDTTVQKAGNVSLTAPPAVTVSATKVTRVAAAQYSMTLGNTIVKATPSGVQDLGSAIYASAAYAGETPAWPSASITFPAGIAPDAVPGPSITAATINGTVSMSAVSSDGQTYTASITGGTATVGNNIVFLISYYIDGTNYTAYAYSYVENIVVPAGIRYSRRANTSFLGGTAGRMYFVSRYLGINVYGNEVTGSATHGYQNFYSDTFVENPATPYNTQLYVSKDGGTSRNYNGGYGADTNRPQATVYMDTSVNPTLASLNFRIQFFQYRDLDADSSHIGLTSTHVQAGFVQSVSANDTDVAPTADATATSQLGLNGTSSIMVDKGDCITANFTGAGPASSGTVYTVTTRNQAPGGDYTLSAYTSVTLTIYKYNKGALRSRLAEIMSGAAGKGINPQSWYYASGWDSFKAAYDQANLILNKPNTDQAAIDSILSTLNNMYNLLSPKVFTYSVNSYLDGTSTPLIPSVTATGAYSGYVLTATAEAVPGYFLTPFDASPAKITLSEANNTINFYYVARQYTLNFQANGGSSTASITRDYNTPVLQPEDPVRDNYTFTGWYYDPACTQVASWPLLMPLNGATLYAGWVLTPVTLTFNSNNGSSVDPVTDVPGTLVPQPADPVRNGFRFDGWFYDISFELPVTWPLELPAGGVTVYAKWTYVTCTISFNSNGGTTVNPITTNPNTAVYPPAAPVRLGYTFAGWYYDNDTFLNPVQWPVIMGTTGYTLYAKWVPLSTTISFDTQGGSAVNPITAPAGSAVSAPASPTKFGYVFSGWALDGVAYTFTTMPTQDITLTAVWTASNKSVDVDLAAYKTVNGELVPATAARAGDIITITLTPKTNFYCGSSRFIIMYDQSFYTIVGANKAAITPNASNGYYANAISSYGGATTSPVSQWPATFTGGESSIYKFVTANFQADTNSANGGHPVIIDGNSTLFSIKLQVKPDAAGYGHIFMDNRWDRSTTYPAGGQYYYYCANGTMLAADGNSVLDFNTDYTGANINIGLDTSTPVQSTISFDSNGGSAVAPITGEAGTVAAPPANPVREGYTFTGWSPAFPSVFPATDVTLTAQWQINTYDAVFMVDGAVYATVPTQYGALISAPANPVKAGYTFTAWSPSVGTMGSSNQTYTAIFLINTYNAYFVVDGVTVATVATEYGAEIQPPSDPNKTGYTFTGWNPVPGTMGAGNMTFTAQFSVNTYNAYFVVDGETVATVPTQYGAQIIAPDDPVKPGQTFLGWTPEVGTMGAGDKTFTAVFTATTYNANFMVDGEIYESVPTEVGQPIIVPADPVRPGYTFIEWDEIPAVMPANDVTINSNWTVNSYTASFVVDGVAYFSADVDFGAAIPLPADPVKTGCTFTGWNPVPATMGAGDMEFNAVFTTNTYIARFMVDSGVYAEVPTAYGEAIAVPTNPAKTGYTFQGWSAIPETMPANDVTINANFAINSYNAVFKVDGSVYATVLTVYGAAIQVPADPFKTGYTFTGWDTVPAAMPASDITINAVFTKNTYNAEFRVDGQVYATVPTAFGDAIALPEAPQKTGYTFAGWSNVPATMPAANVTINALWTVNSYDAVFYVDDGVYATVSVNYGAAIELPAAPVKDGFAFAGWSPEIPATMPAEALEFHAVWVNTHYDAVFMVDGVEYARISTPYGGEIVPPADPEKAGYLFLGWDPGLPTAMPAEDQTFTALWFEIGEVTISFDLNGGTGTVPAEINGAPGAAITLPAQGDITRAYYNFLGWAESPDATVPLTDFTIPSANTTLYAVWSRVPVTLTKQAGSTTVIDTGTNMIYGLAEGMTKADFINNYVTVGGDGTVRCTYYSDSFGTGTKVELVDNVTGDVLETYYIVIFGDIDGDGYITAADENLLDMASSYQIELEGEAFTCAADLTKDGFVDAFDLNILTAANGYSLVIDQTNPDLSA